MQPYPPPRWRRPPYCHSLLSLWRWDPRWARPPLPLVVRSTTGATSSPSVRELHGGREIRRQPLFPPLRREIWRGDPSTSSLPARQALDLRRGGLWICGEVAASSSSRPTRSGYGSGAWSKAGTESAAASSSSRWPPLHLLRRANGGAEHLFRVASSSSPPVRRTVVRACVGGTAAVSSSSQRPPLHPSDVADGGGSGWWWIGGGELHFPTASSSSPLERRAVVAAGGGGTAAAGSGPGTLVFCFFILLKNSLLRA
jgi:hypothetical protein